MKRIKWLIPLWALLIITGDIVATAGALEASQVIHWPAPEGIDHSEDTFVRVMGEDIFVYETAVNNQRAYTEYPELDQTPSAMYPLIFCRGGPIPNTLNLIKPLWRCLILPAPYTV